MEVTVCALCVQLSDQKVKSLESSIEAERAAHLETKFHSEVVQVTHRLLTCGFV